MLNTINPDGSPLLQDGLALQYAIRIPKQKRMVQKALILLHGVGGNEQDLLNAFATMPDDLLIISARGPLTLSAGRYAWFHVDFTTGKPLINEAEENESRQIIKTFIGQISNRYAIDELYLGGFSQGAIMSSTIGLTTPSLVKGVIALSGRILTQIRPLVQKNDELHRLRFFLSHGIHDQTLPVTYAREAKEYLDSLDIPLTYHEYPVGHQINEEELISLTKWIG